MNQVIATNQAYDQLIQLISPWIAPLGYQVIYLEIQSQRQKVLRIYIDHLDGSSSEGVSQSIGQAIGIEDCVKVSRLLDEQLDQIPEVQTYLPGAYELEVSSPGVDRPLRTNQDFQRFAGQEVRVHLYRPLTGDEIENPDYQEKNPKQKNFLGTLVGLQNSKVVLLVDSVNSKDKAAKTKKPGKAEKTAELTTNSVEGLRVAIPLPLISKANLEPHFDFEGATKESHEL